MNLSKNRAGFTVIEVLLVALVIGLVVFLGYVFYNSQLNPNTPANPANTSASDEVPEAPEVNSNDDLDQAKSTLDQVDVEQSNNQDATELDGETNDF